MLKNKEVSNINGPAYSQPICTGLQIALVDLFRNLNISPAAVVGHSSGEIAAASVVSYIKGKSLSNSLTVIVSADFHTSPRAEWHIFAATMLRSWQIQEGLGGP